MKKDELDFGPRKTVAKGLAKKIVDKLGIKSAPVSLQKIIEYFQETQDLNVVRTPLTKKISGLLVVCNDQEKQSVMIGFNPDKPWCHRRFTIAHEIGHMMMGHTCSGNSKDNSYHETEANKFAAELLMPSKFLKTDLQRLKDIPEMAKLYRVSAEALAIRLSEARLLK